MLQLPKKMEKSLFKLIIVLSMTFALFESVASKADFCRLQRIKPWDITKTGNGYNVLLGVSDEIDKSQGPRLIQNLKRIMRAASQELHRITGGKTSFKRVTFVVPNSWTAYSKYSDGATVSKGNFFVRNDDSSDGEPEVQTYLRGESKNKNRAILIPSGYVERSGNGRILEAARDMVEAWFTLRYGIERKSFAEIVREIRDTNTCLNPSDCHKICQLLRKDLNWKRSTDGNTTIFVVRERSKRVVMIIDVSGSMYGNNRLLRLKEGLKQYVISQESIPTSLGIVKFSTTAQTLSNLTNDRVEKEQMLVIIDDLKDEQRTSIGAGIREALEVLLRDAEGTSGAEFILISDGEETDRPFINQTSVEVISRKVTVHTIAITDKADIIRMNALGAATGGLTFNHRDDDIGNEIGNAFSAITGYDNTDPAASGIVIFSERVERRMNPTFSIVLDERIGRNTTYVFECEHRTCAVDITLDAPNRRNFLQYVFNQNSNKVMRREYEIIPRIGQLTVIIYDAEAGSWTVRTRYNQTGALGLTVKTKPNDFSNYPVLAFAFWGKDSIFEDECADDQTMYTLISRDNNPVIGAEVTAIIASSKEFGPYELNDDGKGRDELKNDGIYTGVFPVDIRNITINERFNLKVKVNGKTATQVRTRQLVATAYRRGSPEDSESVHGLQRSVQGGSFISMKANSGACELCDIEVVFLLQPSSTCRIKYPLYGIMEYYVGAKNARVKAGIVSISYTVEVISDLSESIDTVRSLTTWEIDTPSSSADFASGLEMAGSLFPNKSGRKVIVIITEQTTTHNAQQTLAKARHLRSSEIILIPVVINSQPNETFWVEMAGDRNKFITVPRCSGVETQIINLACGFILKT